VNGNSTVPVVVEGGGEQIVAHVGLHALGAFADRFGLGDSLSARIPVTGERLPLHDRGKVLTQAMLMLAGGGEACADIEHLRAQAELFGSVPSDSTLYRTFRQIDPSTLAGLWEAMAEVRAAVWGRSSATTGSATVVLDIDSSLHEIHSEHKQETAATYKGGFGFHPIYCFADASGETLAVRLRPGNAGANNIADHVAVLDGAIAQLPEEIAAGHREGDEPWLVRRAGPVRVDSAGCTEFVWHCRARNVGFAVVARSNASVHAAISRVACDDEAWRPALRQDGDTRPGAAVAELTELVDLWDWPQGTRLIVRREPLHPGAQQSLFPSAMYRYWGHYTDATGDPVALDVHVRRPRSCRGPHPPPEGLRRQSLPVRRHRRQPRLAGGRVLRRRPRALVPAAVPHRRARRRRTEDPALGTVARPRPARAPRPPAHRARRRRLAHHRRPARRLPAPLPHRLSPARSSAPAAPRSRPRPDTASNRLRCPE
jgi:hypothetical protein